MGVMSWKKMEFTMFFQYFSAPRPELPSLPGSLQPTIRVEITDGM
jgi:hypothetical protein